MLTDTIQNSVQTIERLTKQRENKAAAAQFSVALAKLNVSLTQTQKTLDCAEEMKACHVSETPVLTKATLDKLRGAVNDCGSAIHEGALDAYKVQSLEVHAKEAKRELDDAWRQCAPALVETLKSRLAILRDLSADGARIHELENNMQNALTNPVTQERIRSFAQDLALAKRIADRFPLDPEIEAFLQKVSRGRATLADLTPEVFAWLSERQFLRKFRIVSS